MGKRSREGKVQRLKHFQKKIVKNSLQVTTLQHFLYSILTLVWIEFQEKYEVLRHLIKDNSDMKTIKLINSMDKHAFSSVHLILCLFLSNKNRNFQEKL